jgi:hypothetical protein
MVFMVMIAFGNFHGNKEKIAVTNGNTTRWLTEWVALTFGFVLVYDRWH